MFIEQIECFVLNNNIPIELPLPRDNPNKMSSGIYTFFNTEITCIPKAIGKIAGKYYSNAHCNGATWLFFLWTVLHLVFDKYLDALLSKLKFKAYIRTRIKDSLWYLGFYGTALVYCWAALHRDEVELFNFKKMHVPSQTNLSDQIVGFTLICTFYLHSSVWEGLKNGSLNKFTKYLCLVGLCTSAYILRVVEIVYTLTGVIALSEVAAHVTRIIYSVGNKENGCLNIFIKAVFVATFGIFALLHVVVIPLTFVIPLGLKILSDYPNILLIFLYICLLGWLIMELYQSVLFNVFDHWLYHKKEMYNSCPNNLIECSLYMARNDESYNLQLLRKEAKERQQEMISKRKPKNRSMLLQTLKCMMTIKRKISEKRLSNDTSDSDSEKSDEGVLEDLANDTYGETDLQKQKDDDKIHVEGEHKAELARDNKNDIVSELTKQPDGHDNTDYKHQKADADDSKNNLIDEGILKPNTLDSDDISNGGQTKNLLKNRSNSNLESAVAKNIKDSMTERPSTLESDKILNHNQSKPITEELETLVSESAKTSMSGDNIELKPPLETTTDDNSLIDLKHKESDKKIDKKSDKKDDNDPQLETENFLLAEKEEVNDQSLNSDNK